MSSQPSNPAAIHLIAQIALHRRINDNTPTASLTTHSIRFPGPDENSHHPPFTVEYRIRFHRVQDYIQSLINHTLPRDHKPNRRTSISLLYNLYHCSTVLMTFWLIMASNLRAKKIGFSHVLLMRGKSSIWKSLGEQPHLKWVGRRMTDEWSMNYMNRWLTDGKQETAVNDRCTTRERPLNDRWITSERVMHNQCGTDE